VEVLSPRPSNKRQPLNTQIYTVLDTGSKVNGRHLDLFTPDCHRGKTARASTAAGHRSPARLARPMVLMKPSPRPTA